MLPFMDDRDRPEPPPDLLKWFAIRRGTVLDAVELPWKSKVTLSRA